MQIDKEDETHSNKQFQILIEIRTLLRASRNRLASVYLTNHKHYKQLCCTLLDLIVLRSQIRLDNLPTKDLLNVTLLAIASINVANGLLGLDSREFADMMGHVMPAIEHTSTADLYKLHMVAMVRDADCFITKLL